MAEAWVAKAGGEASGGGHRTLGLAVAAAALAADQLAKWLVLNPLRLAERSTDGEGIVLLPVFRFVYTENRGLSMHFLPASSPASRWALVALTAAIAGFVLAWMWREKRRDDVIALGLILGGALGNIADRARLGYVVDFADLHIGHFSPFLVFNVSDAAITIGVLLLLVRALLRPGSGKSGDSGEVVNG